MPAYFTQRGFAMYADLPTEDGNFTVQLSSLATEYRVWVGLGDKRAHLSRDEAHVVVDALKEFLADTVDGDTEDPAHSEMNGSHAIGVLRGGAVARGLDPVDLYECDDCGAVISDPDLHADWHAREPGGSR